MLVLLNTLTSVDTQKMAGPPAVLCGLVIFIFTKSCHGLFAQDKVSTYDIGNFSHF